MEFETELEEEEEELQIGGNCQINPGQCSAARHPILSTMHLPPPLLGSPCFSNPKFALRPSPSALSSEIVSSGIALKASS